MDLAAQMLSQELRDHVTMPTDLSNPEASFTDASTGNRSPPVSCAIQRCLWCSKAERVATEMCHACKEEDSKAYEHSWDFELRLHVLDKHREQLSKVCGAYKLRSGAAWDVCKVALSCREICTEQIAGPSVDRRTLEYSLQLYNDDMVRSLICGVCARICVDIGHEQIDGSFKSGAWFLKLEESKPGILQKA